jgi:hypothetical protein
MPDKRSRRTLPRKRVPCMKVDVRDIGYFDSPTAAKASDTDS